MSGKHSALVRGLTSTKRSLLAQGRFGRLFRELPAAQFGHTEDENRRHLSALGAAMSADFDAPKDGKDEEESGIPALYTYFGQFIDHDLTFDPISTLGKQSDPDALTDYRTPAFDLDSVYGRGPDDQPYLYESPRKLLLGTAVGGAADSHARDLPRNGADPARALIGDPRNDENVIVSELHGLFLRFHNRLAEENPHLEMPELQRLVRFHYQYVVLHDFLPKIVHSDVLAALKTGGAYDREKLLFFRPRNDPFLPIEFSAAAYRFGHSMVRPGYRLNDKFLLPIFPLPKRDLPTGLAGFRALNAGWGIDWGRFVDVDVRPYEGNETDRSRRLQFAYRIDTSVANPLANLPPEVAKDPGSLAERNLLRGWGLGLPSGQRVALAMGVKPLADGDISIGKATGQSGDAKSILDPALGLGTVFAGNCPLWAYILAEAMLNQEKEKIPVKESIAIATPRLGPVGGRIVAEVFLGLLFGDPYSLLRVDPRWHPEQSHYGLKDFVRFALGH